MALKTILVALTTKRDGKRVRFPAGAVVNLTDAEQASMDRLQNATGKLHTRAPIQEGGAARETAPAVVDTGEGGEYLEADRPMGDKTVKGLKAYLDHAEVEYPADADKKALLKLATKAAEDAGNDGDDDGNQDGDNDPDDGL